MNRSDRLQPVAAIAERKEKDAASALGEARQAVSIEEKRFQDLVQYRQEYISDFQRKGRAGLTGAAIKQFQSFLLRLDQAVEQQRERIQGAQTQVTGKVAQWQQKLGQSRALGQVVNQLSQQEQHERDKKDQRSLDDRAAHGIRR